MPLAAVEDFRRSFEAPMSLAAANTGREISARMKNASDGRTEGSSDA